MKEMRLHNESRLGLDIRFGVTLPQSVPAENMGKRKDNVVD